MNSTQHEKEFDEVLKERDSYHDVADRLADCIERITGIDNGEHSSCNCPWQNAEENAGFYVDERDALRDQNAALAAHVERFKEVLDTAASEFGICLCGEPIDSHSFGSDHAPVDACWKLMDDFIGEAPETSLARRDARIAAKAIEEYRQQAEGNA